MKVAMLEQYYYTTYWLSPTADGKYGVLRAECAAEMSYYLLRS